MTTIQFRTAVIALLSGILLQACVSHTPPPTPPKPAPPGYPKPYRVLGQWYQPLPHARDFEQQGIASWYGADFHGRRTSNGEIYDMHALTAAHKTLPLGTFVRVRNLENGRSVDVRVNDRGPFVKERVIDLSYAAAQAIDMDRKGTARVQVVALGAPSPDQAPGRYIPIDYYSGNFTFQIGAFSDRTNAERLVRRLEPEYRDAHIQTFADSRGTFHRVRVGRAASLEEAIRVEQTLIQNGFADTFIVAE